MMKIRVIYFSLCICFVQIASEKNVPGFEEGKRYLYKYELRLATGLNEGEIKQFSAFGTKFKIEIENHEGQLRIQFNDVESGSFNDKIKNIFEELPINYMKPLKSTSIIEELKLPYVVTIENGLIKSFEFSETEHMEVINVKKAIALLLQLNFTPQDPKHDHFYTVNEDGIGGNCATSYNILHAPHENSPEVQVLNVTKLRFYDKCTHRPHMFHISIQGYEQLDTKFEPLQVLAQSEYKIRGTREKYTIENILSNGAVIFTPFTTNGQSILSLVNQTLTLLEIETEMKVKRLENMILDEKLSFKFQMDERANGEKIDLKEAHLNQLVNNMRLSDKSEELAKLLPELVTTFKDKKNTAKIVGKIISYLRTMNYELIRKFYENYIYNSEKNGKAKNIKGIFNEILPYIGSNPSILFAFDAIKNKKVDISIANRWLQKIPFNVKEPSQKLLARFKELVESEPVTKYTKLVNSGWLAYGSLISKGCEQNAFNPHPTYAKQYVDNDTCERLTKELVGKYENANTQMEQSVYLRAIKNTHSAVATKLFLEIAQGGYPLLLRLEAVWALLFHVKHSPEQVMATMVQILSNQHEHYLLRIFAFDILLDLDNGPQQFGVLLQHLQRENCQKVASYIYTTLESYANGSYECPETLALRARFLLRFLDKPKYDILQHTFTRLFTSFNGKYKFGRSTKFVTIPSNTSAVPRAIYLGQFISIMGYGFNLIELGYLSEGNNVFEYTLLNALQPEGLSPEKTKDGEPMPEYLKHVIDDLKLQEAIKEEIKDYEVYCIVFGQDVSYTRAFGFEEGPRFGGPDVTYDGETAHIDMNSVLYVDARLVVPNEVGVAVYITLQVPITYEITGTAKVSPQLSSRDDQVSLSKRLRGVNGEFDIKFISDINVDFEMYTENLLSETFGYGLNTHFGFKLPIKGAVDYDFKTKKFDIKYTPTTDPYDIIHYETHPITFVNQLDKSVHFINTPNNKKFTSDRHYFGFGLELNVTYDSLPSEFSSYSIFYQSFIEKPCHYEQYRYLTDKLYTGIRGSLDYVLFNPTGRPLKLNLRYARCDMQPVSEFFVTSTFSNAYHVVKDDLTSSKKWVLDVVGKGNVDRVWKMEFLSNSQYPYKDKGDASFRFRREGAPGWYNEPFEICYNGNVEFVNYRTLATPNPKAPKVKFEANIFFGDKCSLENPNFEIKSVWDRSEAHSKLDQSQTHHSKQCLEDTKVGHFSEACWELIKDLGRITKFSFEIHHKNMPHNMKEHLHKTYLFLRHYFYDNLEIEAFKGAIEEGNVRVIANVSYDQPIVDVHVYRPYETVHYSNIYIPSVFPKYEPYTIAEPLSDRLKRMLFGYESRTYDDSSFAAK